jgi:hypothetical protein
MRRWRRRVSSETSKWLAKANDEVISYCACNHAVAATPGQLDCPWCGCGWLIPCAHCRKSFTYAQVVEFDRSYSDLARVNLADHEAEESEIEDLASWMERAVARFRCGDVVVYLDGAYHHHAERDLRFEGWFAEHDLPVLPHAEARTRNDLDGVLGKAAYWFDRELPDRSGE